MKKIIFITLAFFAVSCKYLERSSGDAIVAEVGKNKLYESEIRALIPPGKSPADSLEMLNQYINRWAIKHLLLSKAESELSKDDKDVTQELDEYRSSLLMYRFEKMYIDQRLDTLITESECREYYEKNSSNFILTNSVVKARFVKVSSTSPNLERLKRLYKAESIEDVEEFERLCYSSADKYNNFNNEWIDLSVVAKEIPLDLTASEKEISSKSSIETSDSLYTYLVFFPEKIRTDEKAPFEYYRTRIKEIILSKRKQDLILKLEQDLIREGLDQKYLKTNINRK